jgi:hypothetical protein
VWPGENVSPRIPAWATWYPADFRRPSASGCHGLIIWFSVRCPWTWGYRPVRNDTRLCVQNGCCPNAWLNRVPRAARASMLGVDATGLPKHPSASARSWSGMKTTMLGRVTP